MGVGAYMEMGAYSGDYGIWIPASNVMYILSQYSAYHQYWCSPLCRLLFACTGGTHWCGEVPTSVWKQTGVWRWPEKDHCVGCSGRVCFSNRDVPQQPFLLFASIPIVTCTLARSVDLMHSWNYLAYYLGMLTLPHSLCHWCYVMHAAPTTGKTCVRFWLSTDSLL